MIWKDFWLENGMMCCSGDKMDFLSGGQKKYVNWSTRRFWGRGMCGLSVWLAWWTARCSEV